MESKWLFVLSQYVFDINVGKINQCVVCGGGKGRRAKTEGRGLRRVSTGNGMDGKTAVLSSILSPHIPQNCNLRKIVSLSQKLREWNTSGFEYQTRNRVHVETALISLRQPLSTLPGSGI